MTVTVGRLVQIVAGLAAAIALWFFFAPPFLGGSTSYVVTDGTSMRPLFHTGDVALVRGGGTYRVGDIAAYRSRMFHTIVLHRIVAVHGDRYVFKGDNNDFRDPEQPHAGQLLGKLWLRAPALDRVFGALRRPLLAALLIGIGVALFLGVGGEERRRRRSSPVPHARPSLLRAGKAAALGGLVVFVAGALVVAVLPRSTLGSTRVAYTQHGAVGLAAHVAPSVVYPQGRVRANEPVFLALVDRLHVRFAYRLDGSASRSLSGQAWLDARVKAATGWTRRLSLGPPTAVTGPRVVAAGTLGLHALRTLLDRVEAATETPGGTYTVTVVGHVRAHGSVAGMPVATSFSTSRTLVLDDDRLQASDPGVRAARGSVDRPRLVPSTLGLGPVELSTTTAGRLAWLAAVLCALALGVLSRLREAPAPDEAERIRARYGAALVPVESIATHAGGHTVVDVPDVKTLVRLAEQYGRMILVEESSGRHRYAVPEDGMLYVYAVHRREPPRRLRITAA